MKGVGGNAATVAGSPPGVGVPTATSVLGMADVPAPAAAGLGINDGVPSATAAGVAPDGEKAYSGDSFGDRLASLVFRSDSTAEAALADGAKITR